MDEYNHYDRKQLYHEVWERPMKEVAQSYGISDVMLKKICGRLNVPTPPRGYWAKVSAGKKVKKPVLPRVSQCDVVVGRRSRSSSAKSLEQEPIDQLGAEAADFIRQVAATIEYHPKAKLRSMFIKVKEEGGWPERCRRANNPQSYILREEVSSGQMNRCMAMLEALARGFDAIGGRFSDVLTVRVLGESVPLRISESTTREPHTITKRELEELNRYEKGGWYKPNIRKWDQCFNGLLKISVGEESRYLPRGVSSDDRRRFRESGSAPLDSRLPELFLAICNVAAARRIERLEKDKEVAQLEQAVAKEQARVDRYNVEAARLRLALKEAENCRVAQVLASYADDVESSGLENAECYATWLRAKASWINPLIRTKDPILGSFDDAGFPPEALPDVSTALPHEHKWFYERRGGLRPDTTWDAFEQMLGQAD